jgi:predicted SAM-dependent methyltransferase
MYELIDGLNVQYGAGWTAPLGWLNFDSSPSVRIERLPLLGRFLTVNAARFPDRLLYGDIIEGLPVAPSCAKAIYASHVLEHLAYNDCRKAIANTFAILKPGGVFRLIVPDLRERTQRYISALAAGEDAAADDFCRSTLFGIAERPKGIVQHLRSLFGNAHHLWMYDEASMMRMLKDTGFTAIRRCTFGDAEDPDFRMVEDESRFFDPDSNIAELAIEAKRPR